jgi:hypothetical protein
MNRIRSIRWLLLALLMIALPAASFAGVFVNITIAPPVLPVYVQPACPGDGYIWTPGYWAYGPAGYFWVPGTWVLAPAPGLLWTPGYWGWGGGFYVWHAGYWGPHVGFYGGVNYGFGYFGTGFAGGYWNGGHFFYNRSVTNINITNVHIYNRTVVNTTVVNRVSYNGGAGGINLRPTRDEENFGRERHVGETSRQMQHERTASENRDMLASNNHGRPAIAATERPGDFRDRGNVGARNMNSDRNSVPRPGNGNNARPENTARNTGMEHNNVPRPPASESRNATRGQQTYRPDARPQNVQRSQNVPRPQNEVRAENHSRPQVENHPRPQNEPRAQAPRPQSKPHETRAPQPHNAPVERQSRPGEHEGRPAGGPHGR